MRFNSENRIFIAEYLFLENIALSRSLNHKYLIINADLFLEKMTMSRFCLQYTAKMFTRGSSDASW